MTPCACYWVKRGGAITRLTRGGRKPLTYDTPPHALNIALAPNNVRFLHLVGVLRGMAFYEERSCRSVADDRALLLR